MSQNRNRWLDIAKGIAIILMVAGHTPIPSVMSHFIYAFHMPLFFISSGLVSNYEKYSLVDYIKHKSYTLVTIQNWRIDYHVSFPYLRAKLKT